MNRVVRQLRRVVARQDAAGRTDGQLLAAFLDQGDEVAFEALVRRLSPMVFGVCRRVVHNHHDAEDAFQATFLVLARKASTVRPRDQVAGWLHGVALRTALKAKVRAAKRRGRERQATTLPEREDTSPLPWSDLRPLIDTELNGLPERYRLPILLCDLQAKTIQDAAGQLGWPQGTLAGRLARGRKLLAGRLANRGVVLSAGTLGVSVAGTTASAGMPPALLRETLDVTIRVAVMRAPAAGVVPAKVLALMAGGLPSMFQAKFTAVLTALVMLGVVAGGAFLVPQAPLGESTESNPAHDNAGQSAVTKAIYPVADLVIPPDTSPVTVRVSQEPKAFRDPVRKPLSPTRTVERELIDEITRTIAPGTWEGQGQGTIAYHADTFSLSIVHTRAVHEQVVSRLAALRRAQPATISLEMPVLRVPERIWKALGMKFEANRATLLERGEFERVLRVVQEDQAASICRFPKVTCFEKQPVAIQYDEDGVPVAFQAVGSVAPDRKGIRLSLRLERSGVEQARAEEAVAEGSAVALCGWPVTLETRQEFGPPVISAIPYVRRLFTNIGYGREPGRLVLIVMPRLIPDQEESR
jgi:RNA polymerase sigma factor (sigma-70 family)